MLHPGALRDVRRGSASDRLGQPESTPGGGHRCMNPSPIARRPGAGFIRDVSHHRHARARGAVLRLLPTVVSARSACAHRLRRCGVRRIVCSHHSALACDVERGNALMEEVIRAHPERIPGLLGDQSELPGDDRERPALLPSENRVRRPQVLAGLSSRAGQLAEVLRRPWNSPTITSCSSWCTRSAKARSMRRKCSARSATLSAGPVPHGTFGIRRMGEVGGHRPRPAQRVSGL